MISYILPWYYRLDWFRLTLPHNAAIFGHDAEVVIAVDEPASGKELFELVKQWPSIRFVVIENQAEHSWRPPCKAINVAARHASGSHLVIASPESILLFPDRIVGYTKEVQLGVLWNIEVGQDGHAINEKLSHFKTTWPPSNFGYGFIMVPTWAFEAVRGYDEKRTMRNGDDEDFRLRLLRFGVPFRVNPQINIFHPWHYEQRDPSKDPIRAEPILSEREWGRDFSRVIWDWKSVK